MCNEVSADNVPLPCVKVHKELMDVETLQSEFQRLLWIKEEMEQSTATEEPRESTATEEPSQSTATEEPTESAATEEPTESTATEEPTESTATEEPQKPANAKPDDEDSRRPVATPTRVTAKREASEHPGEPSQKKPRRLYTRQDLLLCARPGSMFRLLFFNISLSRCIRFPYM